MMVCRIFSMLLTFISLVLLLLAVITDYWIVAYGTREMVHSGLWRMCRNGNCFVPDVTFDYIIVTRAFLIMASLISLVVVIVYLASFMPCDCGVLDKPFIAPIAAIIAGLFALTAISVFTAKSYGKNVDQQIQVTFEWSFYLVWAAFSTLLLTGTLNIVAYLCSPRSSYSNI